MDPESDQLAALLRAAYPRVLARVLAFTRDLGSAEDAVQDAMLKALGSWPRDGTPDVPAAWLVTVAKNRHTDHLRKQGRVEQHRHSLVAMQEACGFRPQWVAGFTSEWGDDLLRLVFTACDPVLGFDERSALTLSTVAGMSVAEIARAFLVAPRTMEQRLTRARRRLRERRPEYDVPDSRVAPERLEAVLTVIYLMYNEGYWSGDDAEPIRQQLCRVALSLARSLMALLPEAWEVRGLCALLLFHEARAPGRLDELGQPVALPDQDRSQWDAARLREAEGILQDSLARGDPGAYQIEAAIAAVHCSAVSAEATDWPQIAELYQLLATHRPHQSVWINWAFATGQAEGPAAGLALLEGIAPDQPYAAMVRGVLLAEAGQRTAAIECLTKAEAVARNAHERREIARRLAKLTEE